jgi:hypothetical protein
MSFNLAWLLSVAVLVAVYAACGRVSRKSVVGLLVDTRERYSLNHFQITVWTFLVISTLSAAFISSGGDVAALEIPNQLLILMGISLGSAAASGAVKAMKDDTRPGAIARAGKLTLKNGTTRDIVTRPAQVFMEEEGDRADEVVSITKFQSFVFTVVVALAYIVLTFKTQDYPVLPEQVLWLMGTSQAGYVAGKVPNVG